VKSLANTLYQLIRLYGQLVVLGRWRKPGKPVVGPAQTVSDC
jgi:hypothetical protein